MDADTTSAAADRRKSGRTIRKPDLFAEEHHGGSLLSNGSVKRKRTENGAESEQDLEDGASTSETSEDSEGAPDEEEMREQKRRARNTKSPHNAKRAKTNGASATLAIRSAKSPSKPRSKVGQIQRARARPSQMYQEGLYAEVFGRGKSGEDAAQAWYESLQVNSVDAIRDLVNFMLQCIGSDFKVESYDIEDLDNVPNKLGDVVDEFSAKKNAEYPLISKLKQFAGFREALEDFFKAVVQSLHVSSTLYDDEAVFDNIQTWVATMSAASLRPFRHTATVISLAISNALCEVAGQLQGSTATSRKQIESEKSKKSVNKGRVKLIEETVAADEKKLAAIDLLLKDVFDTVFVHRYRDVDEKIRVDCANALGHWISTYRKMFLEGQYLRYLGWVLSDTNMHTRLEVIRQLKALFKEKKNVAALRAFTERFRPRIVEMGARDADIGVRVEAIELLDRIRNAELLEPDDIDTIGRLIFDVEPRVRRAVSKFFVSNIEDLYKASTEELDVEQYAAALPKQEDNEDYLNPTQSWIKFKCLAQTLSGYDNDGESVEQSERAKESFVNEEMDSRYMLATVSIFPHMKDLYTWESLAGYLLYDHSQIVSEADDADVALAVQGSYKLESGEEKVLLDVLYAAVKLYLQQVIESQSDKKGKKTKATKDAIQEKLSSAAHNLTLIVPQLLNKFGSTPSAATSILRLEQLLDIDIAQDDTTASALLEDINKQFVSHSDRKVLAEASKALRQARSYELSKEAADAKVNEIWDESISTLQNLLKGQNIDTRGTLPVNVLGEVSNTVTRLSNLAGISDCTAILERKLPVAAAGRRGQKSKASSEQTLLGLLMQLARRGVPDEETTEHFDELEDQLCESVVATLSLYFRWKVVGLKTAIEANNAKSPVLSNGSLVNLTLHRVNFIEVLTLILSPRAPLDHVRIDAIVTSLDVFTLFATVRHMRVKKANQELPEEVQTNLRSLIVEVPEDLVKEIMVSHAALERSFARRTRRKIDMKTVAKEIGVEDAPVDSDDDTEDNDDDEADGEEEVHGKEARKAAVLVAEQRLCEVTSKIVLAVIGEVVKGERVKERLMVNRNKLGKSYGLVIAYLDEKKKKNNPKDRTKMAAPAKKDLKKTVLEPLVLEDDDIEDDEEDVARNEGLVDDNDDVGEQEQQDGEGEEDEPVAQDVDEIMGD